MEAEEFENDIIVTYDGFKMEYVLQQGKVPGS